MTRIGSALRGDHCASRDRIFIYSLTKRTVDRPRDDNTPEEIEIRCSRHPILRTVPIRVIRVIREIRGPQLPFSLGRGRS
jgi:hypothetical protein